jgi:hypothetical protein
VDPEYFLISITETKFAMPTFFKAQTVVQLQLTGTVTSNEPYAIELRRFGCLTVTVYQ